MSSPHFWTYDALKDVVWALRRSLRRVPVEELGATPAANSWREVQDWLRIAEQVVEEPNADEQFIRIPAFPLSGVQLRDLEKEITAAERRVERQKQPTGSPNLPWTLSVPLLSLRQLAQVTVNQARRSSLYIFVVLLVSLAVDLLDLVFFANSLRLFVVMGANLLVGLLAVGVWWWHHSDLSHHRRVLRWLHSSYNQKSESATSSI